MSLSHTFHYETPEDLMEQMGALLEKMRNTRMTPFAEVRARYPHLKDGAFYCRLNRFRGDYPREMSPSGKRTEKLFVTPELHAHLSK